MSKESARVDAVRIEAVRGDGEPEVLDRRSAVHPLELPRLLGNVLGDIRTIAEHMAELPKLLQTLNSINDRVDVLNDEVHQMRMRVSSMADDVGEVRGGIERVEPALQDVSDVVHPLRRIGGRTRRREPRAGG